MISLKICIIILSLLSLSFSQSIDIKGILMDNSTKLPITGAVVQLTQNKTLIDTTDSEGKFELSDATSIYSGIKSKVSNAGAPALVFHRDGMIRFNLERNMEVMIRSFSLQGKQVSFIHKKLKAGPQKINTSIKTSGVYILKINIGGNISWIKQMGYGNFFSTKKAKSGIGHFVFGREEPSSKNPTRNFSDTLRIRSKLYARNYPVSMSETSDLKIGIMAKRARVINTTDLRADPDDRQSLVRLMVMSNEYDLPGIPVTTSGWLKNQGSAGMTVLNGIVGAYKEVYNNLKVHAKGDHVPEYPTPDEMDAKQIFGQKGYGMADVGNGKNSQGSDLIVEEAFNDDPRPLWVTSWGGSNTLAQAFHQVKSTKTEAEIKQFLNKIRCYDILGQDDAGAFLTKTYPDIFYIRSQCVYGWQPSNKNNQSWMQTHVQSHGPLGKQFPNIAWNQEGDTPAFMHLASYGLNDPCEIDWGGWGGRFSWQKKQNQKAMKCVGNGQDKYKPYNMYGNTGECTNAISKWKEGYNNDFEARMDWTMTDDYSKVNHHPVAVINGDSTRHFIEINDEAGKKYTLDASGSFDSDAADNLSFYWEFYKEPSTVGSLDIQGGNSPKCTVTVPSGSGKEAHIVLRVVDDGNPKLTSYRRIIITVK